MLLGTTCKVWSTAAAAGLQQRFGCDSNTRVKYNPDLSARAKYFVEKIGELTTKIVHREEIGELARKSNSNMAAFGESAIVIGGVSVEVSERIVSISTFRPCLVGGSAEYERLFSQMNYVKTKLRNLLSKFLAPCLRVTAVKL